MEGFCRLTRFAAVFTVLSGIACAQPVPRITAPAPGRIVHAGEPIDVTVEVSGSPVRAIVANVVGSANGPDGLEAPPYRFSFTLPSTRELGPTSVLAFGITAAGEYFADPVVVDLERPDAPTRVDINFSRLEMEVGDTIPYLVQATFSDGTSINVAESTETTFTPADGNVVLVQNRSVTALAVGSTTVTIRYKDQEARSKVSVSARRN